MHCCTNNVSVCVIPIEMKVVPCNGMCTVIFIVEMVALFEVAEA